MAEPERKTILLDVDGTCTIGPGPTLDSFAPIQTGLRAFLGALKDRGYEIIIFSARSPVRLVEEFFKREGLTRYVDGFTRTKAPARLMLDDRAIQFRGDFSRALNEIDNFKPHWEKSPEAAPAESAPVSSVSAPGS